MARPQDGIKVGQQVLVQAQGPGGVPAEAGPVCDVVAGGQSAGVEGALSALAEGQLVAAVVQGLEVLAEDCLGSGEGGVRPQKILLCGSGAVVEFGLQEGDLQAGISLRVCAGAVDGVCGFCWLVVPR